MDREDPAVVRLRTYLERVPNGGSLDSGEVKQLLKAAWAHITGATEKRTSPEKLDRLEDLAWAPPVLSFRIERHGATMKGSTRAEVHVWDVNVETATATVELAGVRQVRQQSPPWRIEPVVAELMRAIVERRDDPRLQWGSGDSVQLKIARIVPESGPKQTVATRRKRIREALEEALTKMGWSSPRPNRFVPPGR